METIELKKDYGIIEFLDLFTEEYCLEYLTNSICVNGILHCPHCGSEKPYKTNRGYKCSDNQCYKRFTVKSYTIMKNSKIKLRDWFFIIFQNSLNKKSLSSVQYGRNHSLTQKSAWYIQHKIRSTYAQDETKLKGIIEVDEAFCSADRKNGYKTWWGGISTRKAPILGLIERRGRVIVKVVPDRRRQTLIPMIQKYVEVGSTVYTDGYAGYRSLKDLGYEHDWVEHTTQQWTNGDVHTNSIEGFWSHFKKSVRNAHHFVSNKHIQSYLDEAVFKYNNRHLSQMERFDLILQNCINI